MKCSPSAENGGVAEILLFISCSIFSSSCCLCSFLCLDWRWFTLYAMGCSLRCLKCGGDWSLFKEQRWTVTKCEEFLKPSGLSSYFKPSLFSNLQYSPFSLSTKDLLSYFIEMIDAIVGENMHSLTNTAVLVQLISCHCFQKENPAVNLLVFFPLLWSHQNSSKAQFLSAYFILNSLQSDSLLLFYFFHITLWQI